jgi:hypothetical protein
LGNLFSGCRIRRPEFVWFHLRRFWHQPLLGSEREREAQSDLQFCRPWF